MVEKNSVYEERRKGKVTSYYIRKEMAQQLDKILDLEKLNHGLKSRNSLIVRVLSNFVGEYFEDDKFAKALSKSSDIDQWKQNKNN